LRAIPILRRKGFREGECNCSIQDAGLAVNGLVHAFAGTAEVDRVRIFVLNETFVNDRLRVCKS
jgi:hypothetical protein